MTRSAFVFALLGALSMNAIGQVSSPTNTNSGPATEGPLPTTCDSKNFPIDKGGSPSCCQVGSEIFHVVEENNLLLKKLAHRSTGPACSMANGSINCSTTGNNLLYPRCDYGPCAVKIVQTWEGQHVEVFKPRSEPRSCGYQVTLGSHVVTRSPEEFDGQKQYPEVSASCIYTRCIPGGTPGVTLTLTAETHNATGTVESFPPAIKLSGAGTRSMDFSQPVTLVAEPRGSHAIAKFHNCVQPEPADFGKKTQCLVTLSHDPKVSVTYECHAGAACEVVNQPTTH